MGDHLLLNEASSDVYLKVRYDGYSWRIPAHSLLLQSKSPLFKEMLEAREIDALASPLTLTEMKPDTAMAIMKYIYTGTIPTNISTNLLVIAQKFGLKDLRDELENRLMPHLTISKACQMIEDLEHEALKQKECGLELICLNLLQKYAYILLSSDLVFSLSRDTFMTLLQSDKLNVPDETCVFWGVWRWGLYYSAKNGRKIDNENVASYIADLLGLIRHCSLRNKEGIPCVALNMFNKDKSVSRRSRFYPPEDSLEQSSSLTTCRSWEEITPGTTDYMCLQMSFDKDVMLVGITLECCCNSLEESKVYMRILQESNGRELLRQELDCSKVSVRKLSQTGEAESWIESDVVLLEPLILRRSEIFSVYLLVISDTHWALPRATIRSERKKIDSTFAKLHGQYVSGIRELHLVPDMTVSWERQ